MNPGEIIWYLGAFILALGVLVTVHEWGHYLAARMCGVKVLRFSVGFGKALYTRTSGVDRTEWVVAAIPLGGFVKMLDEREGTVALNELPRAFNRQSVGRRSLIVLAGPLANLLLAVLIYWVIFLQGVQELRPVLGSPSVGSIAAKAGVTAGERVRSVTGVAVNTWQELRWELLQLAIDKRVAELVVENPEGKLAYRRLELGEFDTAKLDKDIVQELGLTPFRPEIKPVIGKVVPDSPAERVGMRVGDEVLSIDDQEIQTWGELAMAIRLAPERMLRLEILRGGSPIVIKVLPELVSDAKGAVGRIGIGAEEDPQLREFMFVIVQLGALDALTRAFIQTWDTASFTLRMMGRMLFGDVSWKNVSGPVTIADYAGQSAHMGITHYLRFIALVSISLGVLNLLPIPVLDGGHLLYHLAELIKGGPLSERAVEIGQRIGLFLLVMLMATAIYNDINRLVSG